MINIGDILKYLDSENIEYVFSGDECEMVEGFSSLNHYKNSSFTWIKSEKNIPEDFDLSKIRLAIVSEDVDVEIENIIKTNQSKKAFFGTIEKFYNSDIKKEPVGKFTYISPNVKIGKNVTIGHNCTLDGDITIGDNTVIWNNVTIVNRVSIGCNCEIQSGTVIGHDGFGYTEDENHNKTMIKHFGGVTIGDNVRLGMNNVVARGVIDDTLIGSGTKMSDLCHIGHNNIIERNCTIINSALYGSCHTKENAYLSYCVVRNQSTIGANAFVGMGSVVIKNIEQGQVVVGNPAKPLKK